MKIALINTLYPPNVVGGAEKSVQLLAEGFVRAGHEAVVLFSGPEPGIRNRNLAGVRTYEIGIRNLYWPFGGKPDGLKPIWHAIDTYNPAMAKAAQGIIANERPDIIHTNNLANFSVAVWKIAKEMDLTLVHTLRDHYLICPRTTMFRNGKSCGAQCLDCRAYSYLRGRATAHVDAVVGISSYILEKHLRHHCFASTSERAVIPNSYEAPQCLPLKTTPGRRLRVGYLGQLADYKGVSYVLRLLRDHYQGEVDVYLAGRGTPAYLQYIQGLGFGPNLWNLGFTDPTNLLSKIDVLLVPSLSNEAFGRTIIEAYAHGIPVVGARRGGIPELIDEGITGFLFDPSIEGSFIGAVSPFFKDLGLASTMRPSCLKRASDFLPSTITEKYLELFQRVRLPGRGES